MSGYPDFLLKKLNLCFYVYGMFAYTYVNAPCACSACGSLWIPGTGVVLVSIMLVLRLEPGGLWKINKCS